MSEELVNQLTLNYLISHTQLQKLNKKIKENQDDTRNKELTVYKDRLLQLFNNLLVNQQSEDLLLDVKNSFDNFIDKSVYYFKMCDTNDEDDNEANSNDDEDDNEANTNDEDDNEANTNDNEDDNEDTNDEEPKHVTPRRFKRIPSGTNNINNVPINWFTANFKKT
jgi:hypothetical protein